MVDRDGRRRCDDCGLPAGRTAVRFAHDLERYYLDPHPIEAALRWRLGERMAEEATATQQKGDDNASKT